MSIQVPSRTLTMKPGEHAPNCSVTDRALKENSRRRHCTITLRRKSGRLLVVMSLMEKRTKFRAIILHVYPLRSRCAQECAKRIRLHSHIVCPESSIFIEFTIKSAMKLVVEPPATVGLGLCSAAIHDVSCDYLFTALELSALNSWLARIAKTWFAR